MGLDTVADLMLRWWCCSVSCSVAERLHRILLSRRPADRHRCFGIRTTLCTGSATKTDHWPFTLHSRVALRQVSGLLLLNASNLLFHGQRLATETEAFLFLVLQHGAVCLLHCGVMIWHY